MTTTTTQTAQKDQAIQKHPAGQSALVQCYGQIGISAVAAAARYQGAAKNPAYAPSVVKPHRWKADEAA
jgi:hypothetical protein